MNCIAHTRILYLLVAVLLLAACGHDAKRANPLDPVLTTPVELQVALDDTSGTATLIWTAYDSEPAFSAYWVLRALQASDVVDTLSIVTDRSQTTYVDSTSLTGSAYSYRVSVVNAAGLEVPSTAQAVRSLNHPQVGILAVDFDSGSASATVTWSPYAGARFKVYRVLRRAGESVPEVVAEISDIATTSVVDDELRGNTEYRYQVVTLTELDEEIASEEGGGILHPLVDTWPLDLQDGEHVRLYVENGVLVALVAGEDPDDVVIDVGLYVSRPEWWITFCYPNALLQQVRSQLEEQGKVWTRSDQL